MNILILKMFVRVEPEELVVGTKYKLSVFPYKVDIDRYSGIFKESKRGLAYTTLEFDFPYDLTEKKKCIVSNALIISHYYRYYAFISDQPQWKMERRAVNLIVRRLIGDDCFKW